MDFLDLGFLKDYLRVIWLELGGGFVMVDGWVIFMELYFSGGV